MRSLIASYRKSMKTVRKWIKFKYSPRSWEEKSLCYQLFKWIWNRICWRSL